MRQRWQATGTEIRVGIRGPVSVGCFTEVLVLGARVLRVCRGIVHKPW